MLLQFSDHDVVIFKLLYPLLLTNIVHPRENVHAETYALCLSTLVQDIEKQQFLFLAMSMIPAIKAKADWCFRWIQDHNVPFAPRLIAFAAIKGIFFFSPFATIFWLKSWGLMPSLCHSNELISRDEGLHTDFACILYHHLLQKMSPDDITKLVREAIRLEQAFFCGTSMFLKRHHPPIDQVTATLPSDLPGMNARMMSDYIKVIADCLLFTLGFSPLFNKKNLVSLVPKPCPALSDLRKP